jgi:hypothetical protein
MTQIEDLLRQSDPTVSVIPDPESAQGKHIKTQALKAQVLNDAGAPEPSDDKSGPHRRMRLPIVAVVTVVAAVILLVGLLPSQLETTQSAAAAALSDLAAKAADIPALTPGHFVYTETQIQPNGVTAAGGGATPGGRSYESWTQFSVGIVQTWVGADGSGKQVTTTDLNPHFATKADQSNWAKAGGTFSEPPSYTVDVRRFGPGGQGLSTNQLPSQKLSEPYKVATLPTDPTSLRAALCSASVRKRVGVSQEPPNGYAPLESKKPGCNPFQTAVNLLQGPDIGATPALRQALFKVLAAIPGVRLLGQTSDPLGGRGTGLRLVERHPAETSRVTCATESSAGPIDKTVRTSRYPATSTAYTVVVDPKTTTLLSTETTISPLKLRVSAISPCLGGPSVSDQFEEMIPSWTVVVSSGVVGSETAVAGGTLSECAKGSVPTPPFNICVGARDDDAGLADVS